MRFQLRTSSLGSMMYYINTRFDEIDAWYFPFNYIGLVIAWIGFFLVGICTRPVIFLLTLRFEPARVVGIIILYIILSIAMISFITPYKVLKVGVEW